jgi:hypothetical protein
VLLKCGENEKCLQIYVGKPLRKEDYLEDMIIDDRLVLKRILGKRKCGLNATESRYKSFFNPVTKFRVL